MGTIANTDAELVEASRRGELDAFGELVARYQNVVCAVSYSSTGDRALSEDVAQETFVAAWGTLDRVRDGSLRPWLCAIARNLGRKARRRTRREEPIEVAEQIAQGATPFDQIARADSERIVRDALSRLPAKYREVLVLYYCENQSIRDVAQALGIGESAVMQRLSRGRRYLADGVTALVESSLRGSHPRRDLVAAVLATIAAITIPTRVEASSLKKGSTMLKIALASVALVAAGTTAYLVHGSSKVASVTPIAPPRLHYGRGVARRPALGPTAPIHPVAARMATVDDLALLPTDAELVIGADMQKIQTSSLWTSLIAPTLVSSSALGQFQAECGFDPLRALSSITIGLKGTGEHGDVEGSIVMHGFPKAKLFSCIEQLDQQLGSDAPQIAVDGDVMTLTGQRGGIAIKFLDETTALAVIGTNATKAGITSIASQRAANVTSKYAELIGEINTDDALWFAVSDGSPILAEVNERIASATAIRIHGLYASIDLTDGMVVNAGARTGSPALVKTLVEDVRRSMGAQLAQSFTQLDIEADEGDILVSAAVTTSQLLSLVSGSVTTELTTDSDVQTE